MMETLVPPLRDGVLVESGPGGESSGATLVDEALEQRVKLDARGAEVATLLDRTQPLTELAERMGSTPEAAERVVAFLEGRQLLDTPGARAAMSAALRTRQYRQAPAETVPLLMREDAAFSCTMCGSCCGGHNIGPVMPDTVHALADRMDALAEKAGRRGPLFVPISNDGQAGESTPLLCHSVNGSCVFLSDERRCLIHQEVGSEAKPRICRLFPYQFMATPEGVVVSISPECRGLVDARKGTPLRDQEAVIRETLSLVPELRATRARITWDGARTVSYADYLRLEETLHEVVDSAPASVDALVTMGARARVLMEVSASSPPEGLRSGWTALLDGLTAQVAALRAQFETPPEGVSIAIDALDLVDDAVAVLRTRMSDVLRPLARSSQRALFNEKAHQFLMAKELLVTRTLRLGLGRLALQWLLARALMIARARQVKRVHLTDQDVMDAVVSVTYLFRNQAFVEALKPLDDLVVTVCGEGIANLVALAPGWVTAGPELELHKF